ncbi:hypothetical protein HOT99_gp157 [Caulobacter phage CcrBL10]|uniref:Uncharacterized protein n=1 Tax=Caulobacter phage CcrBL10 TaxID=2283269 RepID=A0A385E9V3_9CAUD|nr:hypothetical protein HOT99_gp157 [Caulobacter phage CcrBL10]AXQ68460.1 hypothetical protein CcrBL10_gp256 [Caulobacter phage CcrBL10]
MAGPQYTWEPASTADGVKLTEHVIRGEIVPICVGSSLHAIEMHAMMGERLYRAFGTMSGDADWTQAEIGTPQAHPLDGQDLNALDYHTRVREEYRRDIATAGGRHLMICRKTDDLQDLLALIPMDLRRRHEMANMITLLARMLLIENTPRTLSDSSLKRF